MIPFRGLEAGLIGTGVEDIRQIGAYLKAQQEFRKALNAGYGTDVAALTGGGALRLQSLDTTLAAVIQQFKDFKFYNAIATRDASATVDEYTVQSGVGGFPGGAFNPETGSITERTGTYARKTLQMKYLMTMRSVSVVQNIQRTQVDSVAQEKTNGTLELLTSIEWALFNGDSRIVPEQFDGLTRIVEIDTADSALIRDCRGDGLDFQARQALDIAQNVTDQGRFGRITNLYCSPAVKNAELDQKLAPAIRVPLGQGSNARDLGSPVKGIQSDSGDIEIERDVFIQEGQPPWESRGGDYPSMATANGAGPTVSAPAAGSNAASQFAAEHAGAYIYTVEGITKDGNTLGTLSAAVTVAAGDQVTFNITNPANSKITGFCIYRSRKNGITSPSGTAKADCREMIRIPRTGAADGVATTAFVDRNADIPGTSRAYLVNQTPGAMAVTLVRYQPMMMFKLFPVNSLIIPWAQAWFGALRVAKPQHCGIIKNILPRSAPWRPFNN